MQVDEKEVGTQIDRFKSFWIQAQSSGPFLPYCMADRAAVLLCDFLVRVRNTHTHTRLGPIFNIGKNAPQGISISVSYLKTDIFGWLRFEVTERDMSTGCSVKSSLRRAAIRRRGIQ